MVGKANFSPFTFTFLARNKGLTVDFVNFVNGTDVGMVQRPDLPLVYIEGKSGLALHERIAFSPLRLP